MKMNVLIVLSLILCSASCEKLFDHAYSIKIQNSSKDTVLFYESYNYPDTTIDVIKPRLKMVYPSEYSFLDSKKEWKDVLVSPKDTISIFILSKDIVDRYSWDAIRRSYNILKRYDLSLNDLQDLNWQLSYPPSSNMSGVKMYPRYGK